MVGASYNNEQLMILFSSLVSVYCLGGASWDEQDNVLLFVYVRVWRCLVIKNIVVKHHQEVAKNQRKEKLHVNTKLQGIKVQDN